MLLETLLAVGVALVAAGSGLALDRIFAATQMPLCLIQIVGNALLFAVVYSAVTATKALPALATFTFASFAFSNQPLLQQKLRKSLSWQYRDNS